MKYYHYIIFLAVCACGQTHDQGDTSVSSAEKLIDEAIEYDQNTARGNINTNNYYGGSIGGLNNYYGGGNGKYFGRDIEEYLFDKKLSDAEKYERFRGNHRYFGYDQGNPDIHGRIKRPCQAYDLFCIRKFFAEHSKCKISGRQVPDPLFRAQSTLNFPNVNISATLINLEYKGIKNGRVEEFYIDEVTDNLVLTLDFDAILMATPNAYLKYYLRGREPIVTRDAEAAAFYSIRKWVILDSCQKCPGSNTYCPGMKVSITVVIPNLKDLKLDRAEIFTTSEPISPFLAGPRFAISTDPEVSLMFAEALTKVPISTEELLLTEGIFYASNFIQYNICDFGLKVL